MIMMNILLFQSFKLTVESISVQRKNPEIKDYAVFRQCFKIFYN